MRMLINVFTFKRVHMLTHAAYHLTVIDQCHVRFATLADKKSGVCDDIKYT